MSIIRRRPLAAAVLSFVAVAGSLLGAAPAQAQPVEAGTVEFSGDPGDFITGGLKYSYVAGVDQLTVSASADNSVVSIGVNGANGDGWSLDFDAPLSQPLVPGTYPDATRYPFNGAGPGLSLSGNGRGCNTLTGTFTVLDASFGPNGYVEAFHATFEQHCEGMEPAARGEVHITNPPPPPELDMDVSVSSDGEANRVNGRAVLHGTVSCTKPTPVQVAGTVVQLQRRTLITGTYATQVDCTPGSPVPWTASARPNGTTPFIRGAVEAETRATGHDADYGRDVTVDTTTVVQLRKSR
jgi:hypothetical protein